MSGERVPPPVRAFTSAKGRRFAVRPGVHHSRHAGDPFRCDEWIIEYEGEPAGKIFRDLVYGRDKLRWHATTRQLYWRLAVDAPTGIGFDVAAFDTVEEVARAWANSADQILDWHAGEEVVTLYGRARRAITRPTP